MLSKTLILVLLFSAGSFAQTITTVVGSSSGTEGDTGDGGPAAKALLRQPTGVAFDGSGNMYIADYMNHRIRKVDATGIITTIAGTGTAGDTGDNGPGTSAQIIARLGPATLVVAEEDVPVLTERLKELGVQMRFEG